MKNSPNILAFETAVGGGSICIYRDGELFSLCGTDDLSRSEELLGNIKSLLSQCSLEVGDIDIVAVSRGPGSFTGIRIGIATALGLARSLDIPCVGVPIFDAIASFYQIESPTTIALPIGKNEVVWKTFGTGISSKDNPGNVCSIDDNASFMEDTGTRSVLLHGSLLSRLPVSVTASLDIEDLGLDLARFAAQQFDQWSADINHSPIYLQNPAKRSNLF